MPIPSDAPPDFAVFEHMEGDEPGLFIVTVKCDFASLETRFVYVVFKTNHDDPDAAENKACCRWEDADRAACRAAIRELAVVHIFPLLSTIPHNTILRSPGGIPTYTLSTIDGSVKLVPGLPKSLKDMETHWLQYLPSIDTISDNTPASAVYDIDDIVVVDIMDEGSRDAKLLILRDQPATRYVGFCIPVSIAFATLEYTRPIKGIVSEMAFLRTLPPHPHLITPPIGYISRIHDGRRVLCGYFLKYYTGGSLRGPDRVGAPVDARIKWAYQIASGLHHLHHVAHTYHGDIKLDNILLDENGDAIIIDLEQGRMNDGNAAPELHAGSLVSISDDGRLSYSTPHSDPDGTCKKREGEDEDDDEGIIEVARRDRPYDIWKDTPRAIEAAEVWSFATALQPLLSDVDAVSAILAECRSEDPNCRPTFAKLEETFLDIYKTLPQ